MRLHTVHFAHPVRFANNRTEKSISWCNSHDRRFEVALDLGARVIVVKNTQPDHADEERYLPSVIWIPMESVKAMFPFAKEEITAPKEPELEDFVRPPIEVKRASPPPGVPQPELVKVKPLKKK